MMRGIVFLSHANPEDNRVTRWLALQLVRAGYAVWSDLTGLIGGEDFWREAERVIRERAVKFVYVLSRVSNVKTGPLNELHVAWAVARQDPARLQDFIIPIRVDDLPYADINIELARLNVIAFSPDWAPGLEQLLKKFAHDGVPRNATSSPRFVTRWWQSRHSAAEGISETPDPYSSNWFRIATSPPFIHLHELSPALPEGIASRWPGLNRGPHFISFASEGDIRAGLPEGVSLRDSRPWPLMDFLDGAAATIPRRQAREAVNRLLRVSWERFMESRGLPLYEMANKAMCGYFTSNLVHEDRVSFRTVSGLTGSRQLIGYRTRSRKTPDGGYQSVRQYWHYGVEARPLAHPHLAFAIHAHVLFSNDGLNIWLGKDALHRARRSACRDWWNDQWRDRLLATMSWLAAGGDSIKLEVGTGLFVVIDCDPHRFVSPVSYTDPDDLPELESFDGDHGGDDGGDDDADEIAE
jgi:hypothetical protein